MGENKSRLAKLLDETAAKMARSREVGLSSAYIEERVPCMKFNEVAAAMIERLPKMVDADDLEISVTEYRGRPWVQITRRWL